VGCADYRIYCDGDSDGDGNDLLYGLDEISVLESDFPERFIYVNLEKMNNGKCDFNK
jgi:hypothetical protein